MKRGVFANTINELGNNSNIIASECEKFGMTWGCKPDCPVFEMGECKDCFFENLKQFFMCGEYCKESAIEDIEKYKSKLTTEEYDYLVGIANDLD